MRPFVILTSSLTLLAVAGCGHSESAAGSRQGIIDGTLAPEITGVVHLRHPHSDLLCSGVVVAPTLVLTAKHCAVRDLDSTDEPLSADGFRIGFGANTEALVFREVERCSWIGAPNEVDVQSAVDGGEDVAALVLSEPVPSGTHIHPVDLDYAPALEDEYQLVGYGLSSLESWDSGAKRTTTDAFAGYDESTGRIQIEGRGACNGDSGGPVLLGSEMSVIGVISQIGGTADGDYCTLGVTFASTVRNEGTRTFVETELAHLPPCADRAEVCDNGQDENCNDVVDEGCGAGGAAGAPGSAGSSPGGFAGGPAETHAGAIGAGGAAGAPRGGTNSVPERRSSEKDGCSCRTIRAEDSASSGYPGLLALLLVLARWSRRCAARGSNGEITAKAGAGR